MRGGDVVMVSIEEDGAPVSKVVRLREFEYS